MGIYRPPVKTLLSLARYAEILGINPIQFMQGDAETSTPALFPPVGLTAPGDRDIWFQYEWQDPNKVSRNELADIIANAEKDISIEMGSWPAPVWTVDEHVRYTKYHRTEYVGLRGYTHAGNYKSVQLKYGQFIVGGTRATTLIGTPTVVYSDEDGDSYSETATVTQATALTDICELKLYYAGNSGEPRYEIRPVRSKTITGGNAVFVLDAWLLFDPEDLSDYPGADGPDPLLITTAGNYVSTVDVYREYNDPEDQATLKWDGAPITCASCTGTGCPQCSPVTQIACILASNKLDLGSVRLAPAATYTAATGAFALGTFCTGREPEWAVMNYRSGIREDPDGNGCYEVPDDLAKAIAMMATARLERPLCTKSENVEAKVKRWKEDLSYFSQQDKSEATVKIVSRDVMSSKFGTRRGEVEAWRIVRQRAKLGITRVPLVALIS